MILVFNGPPKSGKSTLIRNIFYLIGIDAPPASHIVDTNIGKLIHIDTDFHDGMKSIDEVWADVCELNGKGVNVLLEVRDRDWTPPDTSVLMFNLYRVFDPLRMR